MLSCWQADCDDRPLFSDLVATNESQLGELAGYMDMSVTAVADEKLPSDKLEAESSTNARYSWM